MNDCVLDDQTVDQKYHREVLIKLKNEIERKDQICKEQLMDSAPEQLDGSQYIILPIRQFLLHATSIRKVHFESKEESQNGIN